MSYPKAVFLALFLVMSFSVSSFATPVPAHADSDNMFDINISAEALIFNPIPWNSISSIRTAYFFAYATEDYTQGYSGDGSGYNLATTIFKGGDYSTSTSSLAQASGDLAVRFFNQSGIIASFAETIVTIDFKGGAMDIYLPQFDLAVSGDIHFWVANDGSTYFANITDGNGSDGAPNISAQDSIDAEHIAAVATPEPATLALLGLGGYFLRRRK